MLYVIPENMYFQMYKNCKLHVQVLIIKMLAQFPYIERGYNIIKVPSFRKKS